MGEEGIIGNIKLATDQSDNTSEKNREGIKRKNPVIFSRKEEDFIYGEKEGDP